MRYAIYLRVSTEQQAESGLGIEAQREMCMKYIENKKYDDFKIFKDDGYSGSLDSNKRPDLRNALDYLRKGDVLLVARRDRLGRDVLINLLIEREVSKKKCQIETASGEKIDDDDASNVLMRTVVDAIAKHEVMMARDRTKAALAVKKKRGERVGYIPYGYKVREDKKLEINQEEQDVISLIYYLHESGLTYRALTEELRHRNIRNRNNDPWSYVAVFSLIKKLKNKPPQCYLEEHDSQSLPSSP